MPRVIDLADAAACNLSECAEQLGARGFDPHDEESLAHGALWLRRLGNNADFLGDLLIQNLSQRHREEPGGQAYGPQSIVLSPHRGNCFLRANVWPGVDDPLLKASGFTINRPRSNCGWGIAVVPAGTRDDCEMTLPAFISSSPSFTIFNSYSFKW